MVTIARDLVRELLANAAGGRGGALIGPAGTTEIRALATAGGERDFGAGDLGEAGLREVAGKAGVKNPLQIGCWRPAVGGPAKPEAREFPAGKPGFLVLVVAVRGGSAAEWAFWRLDPETVQPVPETVHIIP